MLLLVFRSLAVYGGTAALVVWIAHRFVLPIRRHIAIVLALAPLLFTGKALVTGGVYGPIDILYGATPFAAHREEFGVHSDRTPALGDVPYQMIPWLAASRDAILEGRWPLWNPWILAGTPLLAAQGGAILHPGTWIGLLLPLPQAWTFAMALRLLIALICAYVFLRDLGCGETPSLMGAAAWAFSDFLVFFLGCSLGAAVAPFPLLLLGARRLAGKPGSRSVAITIAGLVLVVTAGHPETVLHTGAAAGLYFLFELAVAEPGRRLRSVALGLLAATLALSLCAVLLLPFAEVVSQTSGHFMRTNWYAHQPRSRSGADSLGRLVPQLVPYAVGVSGHGGMLGGFTLPSSYAGSLLLPFALVGLLSRSRARLYFLGLGTFCLLVCIKTVAADLIARLPLFDIAINEYLIALACFSLCVLAALGADSIRVGEGTRVFVGSSVLSLAVVTWLFLHFRSRMTGLAMPSDYMRSRFLLQVVPLVLVLALVGLLPRKRRSAIGITAVVALLAGVRALEAGAVLPTLPASAFYPPFSVLTKIPRGTPDRMVALGVSLIPNAAAVYGLEDVRGYETMTLRSFAETFPVWCIPQGIWFNRVDDPATPFLAFLSVRWVLAPLDFAAPRGWPTLAEGDGMRLYEKPNALPRAFVPRLVRSEPDPTRRIDLLRSIVDFRERGIVDGDLVPGDWRQNGEARVAIRAYGPQSMDLDVIAQEEALVATSITAWRGWKATIDGRPGQAVGYNHAFLGFRVPKGKHRLALRYAPDGFRYGLLLSLSALVLMTAWLIWRWRVRSGPDATAS